MGLFEEYDYLPNPWECRQDTVDEAYDEARFRQAIADALSEPGRIVEFLAYFTRWHIRATPEGRVERRRVYREPDGERTFGQWEDIPRRFLPPYAGQHTAYPWRADGCVVVDLTGRPVVDCTARGRMPIECEANAALIAAAPDLLYILMAIVARIEMNEANGDGLRLLSGWVVDARAAIAKATGAAPK